MIQEALMSLARIFYIIISNTIQTMIQIFTELHNLFNITSSGSNGITTTLIGAILLSIGLLVFFKIEEDGIKTVGKILIIVALFILIGGIILII